MGRNGTLSEALRVGPAYAHMDERDAELFYSTINALLVYANARLKVVDPAGLAEREENPCMLFHHGGEVSDALWKHRALVDDFVRENPLALSEEQLAIARPWRHALRDMFTVVSADRDRAVYMNRDRLFVVGASQDDADSHVHNVPSLMLLTLLPFKGGIVTDGKTLHLSPRPHDWALPAIVSQATDLARRPPVTTADELVAYAKTVPDDEDRLTPRFRAAVADGFASGLLV